MEALSQGAIYTVNFYELSSLLINGSFVSLPLKQEAKPFTLKSAVLRLFELEVIPGELQLLLFRLKSKQFRFSDRNVMMGRQQRVNEMLQPEL